MEKQKSLKANRHIIPLEKLFIQDICNGVKFSEAIRRRHGKYRANVNRVKRHYFERNYKYTLCKRGKVVQIGKVKNEDATKMK